VLQLIHAAGRKGWGLPGDIREEEFCKKLVADAVGHLGGLDILVSNAARQIAQKSILDITTEQFDATLKTNLYAMFWITKAAVPHMKAGATIINTSSINAYDPEGYILDYAATKGAIAVWTKALAKQLISSGIRVNAVAPGPIWTPLQPSGGQLPGSCRVSAPRRQQGGRASRQNWHRSMCCWRRIVQPIRQARSSARLAE
jgi:NAD(P)-dependent dehydrogenase (short-subunit alcohol dehydrogenase family)